MPRRSFETKIEKIKKRSGKVVRFSPNKIRRAIKGAFKATGQKEAEEIDRLTRKVVADLEERFNSSIIPEVEQVQDIIETLLQEEGHDEVYKAFKLYRQLHHKLRRVSSLVDSDELTEKYLQKADWRVKENANMTYSLQGLNNHVASIISGNFWLNKIYSRQARKAHQSGDIHIHDLSSLSAYCTGWDLKDFLIKGFGGVPGKVHSSPAKHFSTALGQLVNFFYTVQGEVAGAVAVSNFDTYLAPFIRHDGLDYSEVKQNMQEFIFNMNVPTRVGFQTPFTNVSMDLHPTKMVGEESVIIGGEPQDKKYKDFQEEMDMLNKAFAEVMMEGDAQDRVFTFPIPTYSITKDFAWDNEDLEPIWEMTRKFGIPYFCLSKDTIVQEKHKGKITIGMVEKEDRLLTEQGYKKVDQVFHQSAKKIIKIGLANGEIIKATPIHRFPTGDGKIKKVEELTLKDKLVLNQSKQIVLKSKIVLEERDESNFIFWVLNGNSLEKKNLTDLRKGDKVFLETQAEFAGKTDISNFSFEESVFANNTKKINVPKKLNGKLSRLLGYLVGDGSYTGKGRQLPVVTFTNQEEAILEDFERIITDLFGTSLKIRKRNVGKNGETKTLSISSVILRDFLQFLGLDYKQASEKRIPSLIFQTTEENVAQFLRGLFDADGSVGKKGNIVFVSANFNLVKEVWYLLFKLGIFARFVRLSGARTEGYGKLYILGKHAVNFKDKIGFISPHKEKRLREIKTNKPCLGSYSGLSGLLKKLLPEERSALSGKMLGLWEKVHYRHRAKLTRQDLQLILENGLDSKKAGRTIKFICERNLFGDVVQDLKLRKQEQLAIKSLATIDGDFSVVDVSIDSPSHLFMIGSGVLTHNSNFVNSDMDPDDVRSMCCRLRLENKELRRRGGLFSANPLTGCYDEKTEILTSEGWVSFPKLTKEHQVYTLTENDEIETHQPQKLFKYDWEGELYRFKARSLDLLVTPNHRMVVDTTNGARKFVEAQDFVPNTHRIPKKGNWQGEKKKWFTLPREPLKIKMNDWLAFFGIWLAEGSCDNDNIAKDHGYRVNITQKKPHTRQKIKKLLERLPFNCRMTDNGFVICNKQLWTYLKQFGKCYGKYIPDEFKNLSKEQLKTLFDWLVEGDGHIRKTSGQVNYWTSSKRLADDVQEIILKLGYTATITSRKGRTTHIRNREISSDRPIYNVGLLKSKHHRLRKRNISREFYKGQVYCCEVENNTVLVRRNGRVAWCGNSVGVVTVNMPRIGWRAKNETTSEGRAQQRFFTILGELMDVAKNSLMDKRAAVEKFTEKGLYPYCRHYLQDIKERNDVYWRNHFNTIGLNGMNEAMVNMLGKNIATEEGKAFALEVMEYMRKKLLTYQQETGEMFNLEATPAEGTTYRFARLDKEQYPEIACANEKAYQENDAAPYYTNSTHLPVDYTADIFEALDHQDELQCKYTGGTVIHGFLGESLPDTESVKNLVRKVAKNYELPYFSVTPTFSICPKHGYLKGEWEYCPKCDEEIGYQEK